MLDSAKRERQGERRGGSDVQKRYRLAWIVDTVDEETIAKRKRADGSEKENRKASCEVKR